jgi:hypothetical protein
MLKRQHKRGDTFVLTAQYCNDNGTPASLVGYSIKSQLRDKGDNLVHEFVINVTDAALGKFSFDPVNTNQWPLGPLVMDIQYTFDNVVVSTDKIELDIVKKVTRA